MVLVAFNINVDSWCCLVVTFITRCSSTNVFCRRPLLFLLQQTANIDSISNSPGKLVFNANYFGKIHILLLFFGMFQKILQKKRFQIIRMLINQLNLIIV